MQNQSKDWLLAASITLGVGVAATVVVPSGKLGSALLGSTTGAVIGAAVLNGRKVKTEQENEVRRQQLEEQVLKQEEWEKLKAELPGLKATVNQLRQEKTDLAKISGKLPQRQEEYRALGSAITTLTEQHQKLEQQVAARNSEFAGVNGQLIHRQSELQELNRQHEQARQDRVATSEQQRLAQERLHTLQAAFININAQLKTLSSEVDHLESQKRALVDVEAQLAVERAEFTKLATQVQALEVKSQEFTQKSAELELLRATYDGLFSERQSLENKIKELNPELARLQAEKHLLQDAIANLTQQRQELEERVATINQHNPNLKTREQLQAQIEELSLKSSSLEVKMKALGSEVERLESQKRSLVDVEAQLAVKRAEFTSLATQVQALEAKSQEFAQKSAELELLRATYDGLFSERQSLENKIKELNPEITRLEAEKQQIEQAIETQAAEYANSLRLQQEINELRHTIGRLKRQQREQEAEQIRLKDEEAHLTQRIRELQEQIRNIESKIGDTNRRVESALEALKQSPWRESEIPISKWTPLDEQAFLRDFIRYLKDRGLDFPERVIRAFHTSFKVQGISAIVVLAGISGTGKSELPQLYAKYVGALPLVLAVQPRWDSPQDLLGFYNYMEDKFKPTPLIQGIYQYNHEAKLRQDRMVIVLLDEMNLARVEYYFSEFLSKLEARRNHDAYLDIDLGSLPVNDKYRRYKIPEQFLFVGTMNEDETTQTLSDKVLDRANVLTFGKPAQLELGRNSSTSSRPPGYLTYSQFKTWIKSPEPNSPVVHKVTEILNQANEVMEAMGHPFAHRVYQAITQYVVNYPGVEDEKSKPFKAALADQFGQKLLPKLRGIMIEDEHIKTNLKQLAEIIAGIGDDALEIAFTRACQGYQFQWKGLVYQDSQKNERGT